MTHKKAGGSSRNGRDSHSKRLGIKRYGGELIWHWKLNFGREFAGQSTKYSAFKLKLGPLEDMEAELKGEARGTATLSKGIDLSAVEIGAGLSLKGEFLLGSFGPLKLLSPVVGRIAPQLNKRLQAITANVYFKPELSGDLSIELIQSQGLRS